MKKSDIFWQTYLNLEKELLEVAEYIYVTDEIFINNKIKNAIRNWKLFLLILQILLLELVLK